MSIEKEKERIPMSDMKLDNFRLLINDFAASFHFWHDIVGLELIYRDENSIYAYFEAGSTRLELLKADYFASSIGSAQLAPVQAGYRGVVVFRADDVDATYADLVKCGAPPLAPPQDHPAGFARTALLAAPDGYVLEVFTSLHPLPNRT
jgi:lactoylglutathione lyase